MMRAPRLVLASAGCGADSPAIARGASPSLEPSAVEPAPSAPGSEGEAPTPPPTPAEAMPGPAEPAAIVPVEACPREGACLIGSTVPCTLHCAVRADGCVSYSEFVPLGLVASDYPLRFGPVDPAGQWMFYSREWSGNRFDVTPYRWFAAEGFALLSDALGLPSSSLDHESLAVRQVAASSGAILLQRMETDLPIEAYLWTRDAGLTALDFEPSDMSEDGGVVAGVLQGHAVIWDRARGTRRLDGGALGTVTNPAGSAKWQT